jgi:hypothetical protein
MKEQQQLEEEDEEEEVTQEVVVVSAAEDGAKARAAAQAVLRMAEERETTQSPIKKWNERLSATKEQIRNDFQAEMFDLSQQFQSEMSMMNQDLKSTKDQISNALDKARSSISIKPKKAKTEYDDKDTDGKAESDETGDAKHRPDDKILSELVTLELKITHCGLLLSASEQGQDDEDQYSEIVEGPKDENHIIMLMAAIGFLEACVDRMDELVEAGMDDALLPETLEAALVTRERLHLMLERCESPCAASFAE